MLSTVAQLAILRRLRPVLSTAGHAVRRLRLVLPTAGHAIRRLRLVLPTAGHAIRRLRLVLPTVGPTVRRLLVVLPAGAQSVRRLAVCCVCFVALSGATVAAAAPDPGPQVADLAQQYVGSAYRWGGSSPAGFDCTGFVMWIYGQFGVALPHNEAGQLASGPRVGADDLQPGDVLVFANTYRRGLSHVGIYIGDGQFVHAVDEHHGVQVSNLWDAYWAPRFVGASRALT